MKVISKYNLDVSKYNLGNYISSGADGEVFSCGDKVIKFVDIFDDSMKIVTNEFGKNKRIINQIIEKSPKHFVKVFDFELVKVFDKSIVYCYTMEKLNKISEEESKVFDSILSHRDFKKKINYSNSIKIAKELNYFIEFDINKVISFINQIENSKFVHLDIHPRNIMKDSDNNFKLIDLERLIVK